MIFIEKRKEPGLVTRKTPKSVTGVFGEEAAVTYLRSEGYRIKRRNWRIEGHMEIDIIAEDRKYRVFAEVKTRRMRPDTEPKYGTPAYAVDPEKQYNLVCAARLFGKLHPTKKTPRMDIIEVYLDPQDTEHCSLLAVRYIRDAFPG